MCSSVRSRSVLTYQARGDVHRSLRLIVDSVDVGAMFQEQLYNAVVASHYAKPQRRVLPRLRMSAYWFDDGSNMES